MDTQNTVEEKKPYDYTPVEKLGSIRQETATGVIGAGNPDGAFISS